MTDHDSSVQIRDYFSKTLIDRREGIPIAIGISCGLVAGLVIYESLKNVWAVAVGFTVFAIIGAIGRLVIATKIKNYSDDVLEREFNRSQNSIFRNLPPAVVTVIICASLLFYYVIAFKKIIK